MGFVEDPMGLADPPKHSLINLRFGELAALILL